MSAAHSAAPSESGTDVKVPGDVSLESAAPLGVAGADTPAPSTTAAAAVADGETPSLALDTSVGSASVAGLGKVESSALSSHTDGLVLYDLTNIPSPSENQKAFSPHTLKTILGLKLLGIGYERRRLTFCEIRGELAGRLGENITVPTLELSDGSHLTDSWTIAEYLHARHPLGPLLFPHPSSKSYASFLNTWTQTTLGPLIGPLTRPAVWELLDQESREYFEHKKVGSARLATMRAFSPSEREAKAAAVASALAPLEAALEKVQANGGVYLEGGERPSHADFVVFGWYVFSRTAGPALVREMWFAQTPRVGAWVKAMMGFAGEEISGDFV